MYQSNETNSNSLLTEIQSKRENMIECAMQTGYTSEDTIRHSQELDHLIYQFQQKLNRSKKIAEVKSVLNHLLIVLPVFIF